jgi:pimeloyl-ACP methyl ester carboxylesterase
MASDEPKVILLNQKYNIPLVPKRINIVYITFRNKKLRYSDKGSGPVLVLVHGYLESSEVWDSFGTGLAGEFRVICPDLPGHGESGTHGEVHTMEFLAESLLHLLDELQIEKAFIAGHSLGGYVTLAFLELYPERLSGYCLFHSHPHAYSLEAAEKRKAEIGIVERGDRKLIIPENIRNMYAPCNLESMSAAVRHSEDIAELTPAGGIAAVLRGMLLRPSRVWLIEEGRVPFLWILGEKDNYIAHTTVTQGISFPRDSQVIYLKNSGHMGFVEEEEEALKIFRGFLRSKVLRA